MKTINPEVGMQFNSTGIFNDFCADNIGATMHDMKVRVKYELLDGNDKPTGDVILQIEVPIALAQEANALHEYMNALHECYGEDCGHHYFFRIELLEFTAIAEVPASLEDRVRAYFNDTFKDLDECRSAGTVYVGDNGECIVRYLDVEVQQLADILASWGEQFPTEMITVYRTDDNSADVSIC